MKYGSPLEYPPPLLNKLLFLHHKILTRTKVKIKFTKTFMWQGEEISNNKWTPEQKTTGATGKNKYIVYPAPQKTTSGSTVKPEFSLLDKRERTQLYITVYL